MPQLNQHKPRPPDDIIKEALTMYFNLGLSDKDITNQLKDHYDPEVFGLSVITVRRLRKQYGLKSTRQQKHTLESVYEKVRDIRERFPMRGVRAIRQNLRILHGDRVPRSVVILIY